MDLSNACVMYKRLAVRMSSVLEWPGRAGLRGCVGTRGFAGFSTALARRTCFSFLRSSLRVVFSCPVCMCLCVHKWLYMRACVRVMISRMNGRQRDITG